MGLFDIDNPDAALAIAIFEPAPLRSKPGSRPDWKMPIPRFPIGISHDFAVGYGTARSFAARKVIEPIMERGIGIPAIEVTSTHLLEEFPTQIIREKFSINSEFLNGIRDLQ
jgi:hypothetical protein